MFKITKQEILWCLVFGIILGILFYRVGISTVKADSCGPTCMVPALNNSIYHEKWCKATDDKIFIRLEKLEKRVADLENIFNAWFSSKSGTMTSNLNVYYYGICKIENILKCKYCGKIGGLYKYCEQYYNCHYCKVRSLINDYKENKP